VGREGAQQPNLLVGGATVDVDRAQQSTHHRIHLTGFDESRHLRPSCSNK